MKISVRRATINDAAAIAGLCNQLGYPMSVAATRHNIETISKKQDEIILVAVHETLIGWIHVFHTTRLESGSFCEIGGLVIDQQYREKGIGKLLVEHSKSWCIDKGTVLLRVRSNVKRTTAHQFYLRLGFNENKQQKIFEIDLSSV